MRAPRLTPRRYEQLTLVALGSLVAIVITGALVRLTDSGLGCADWPRCSSQKFIDVSGAHAAVEQINRMFTGLVAVLVILAVAGSWWRVPRRRDLTWLSWSLVAGVLAQVVLGGIVVLVHLHPVAVQQHFLVSMALITAGFVLWRRAALPDGRRWVRAVAPATMRAVWAVAGLSGLALITGTVVTGTGPHSGQRHGEPVRRFGFAITSVARVHSITVLVTLATALYLVWLLRRTGDRSRLEAALTGFLAIGITQGVVGYVQYFNDVPAGLVAIHVALATTLWLSVVNLVVATRSGVPAERAADRVELGDGLLEDVLDGPH